jgi:hypothetical protein
MHAISRVSVLAAALGIVFVPLALAAGDVASGPAAGEELAPLKIDVVTGGQQGKQLDYVAHRKDEPTIYVLVREWDRPVARFLKQLDGVLPQESARATAVAAWLTDEKQQTKDYLPRAQQSLSLQNTDLAVFTGDKAGPDGWAINSTARLTVVVAAKGKVVASFGYLSVNETDVPEVRAALKKAVAAKSR